MKSWPTPDVPALTALGAPDNNNSLQLRGVDGALEEVRADDGASLYVCGITPYDATHIGHAATYVAFDLLVRQWLDRGESVAYVQNVTDVDDPLLERATATGEDWESLAGAQTDLFRTDMAALEVVPPTRFRGVVEEIGLIAAAVTKLLEAGVAYTLDNGAGEEPDVYFDSAAANSAWHLGSISGLTVAEMEPLFAERGGDPDRPGKRHRLDPLLWRGRRNGEPFWTPRGVPPGRPGWHIECSALATEYLPQPFTVQGGGSDLIFPHHEFSASHASILTDKPFARHYAHAGMVGLDGEKMSKSRGNLVFVSGLRENGVDPMAIRVAILAHHYRSDWFWSDAELDAARSRLEGWRRAAPHIGRESALALTQQVRAHLAQDLDAPAALRAIDAAATQAITDADRQDTPPSDSGEVLFRATLQALLGVRL